MYLHQDHTTAQLGDKELFVTLKLFLNAQWYLSLWSKLTIGHGKWFLNTNLFLIKTFLITKFDFTYLKKETQILQKNHISCCKFVQEVQKKTKTKNCFREHEFDIWDGLIVVNLLKEIIFILRWIKNGKKFYYILPKILHKSSAIFHLVF